MVGGARSSGQTGAMELGAFSISIPVADLEASQEFYEALGFTVTGGVFEDNWLIMMNGSTVIGLFQGMFDQPMLTFNPGLSVDGGVPQQGEPVDDVRHIQQQLLDAAIEVEVEVEGASGPGHLIVRDPDGNPIMIDQF